MKQILSHLLRKYNTPENPKYIDGSIEKLLEKKKQQTVSVKTQLTQIDFGFKRSGFQKKRGRKPMAKDWFNKQCLYMLCYKHIAFKFNLKTIHNGHIFNLYGSEYDQ
ncbi:hypothetical protein BpHYR1_027184 [Brachionus plicatilis]|uniref:Uncharacterized protein n=1 Tax=Brachionus plicatilis TaxID=10195 RepID=A0A3M7QP75_BRAPC|nr:hypothetical protein BpHYR1_027184 [Brachionus plicatilis]